MEEEEALRKKEGGGVYSQDDWRKLGGEGMLVVGEGIYEDDEVRRKLGDGGIVKGEGCGEGRDEVDAERMRGERGEISGEGGRRPRCSASSATAS
jgi:hypothetical protein